MSKINLLKLCFEFTYAQQRVFDLLVKKKGYVSTQELAKETHLDLTTIQKAMKKMYEKEIVLRIKKSLVSGGYVYGYKLQSKKQIKTLLKVLIRDLAQSFETRIDNWQLK